MSAPRAAASRASTAPTRLAPVMSTTRDSSFIASDLAPQARTTGSGTRVAARATAVNRPIAGAGEHEAQECATDKNRVLHALAPVGDAGPIQKETPVLMD